MTEQFIGKKKLNLSLLIKIVKDTGQGFIDDSVTRLSGSLAYATLFSIIPFLSLLVTIGVVLHMDLANQLYIQLEPIGSGGNWGTSLNYRKCRKNGLFRICSYC